MTLALCLLAAAIWLAGGSRAQGGSGARSGSAIEGRDCASGVAAERNARGPKRPRSTRHLRWLAAGATMAITTVLLGPVLGGMAGVPIAALVNAAIGWLHRHQRMRSSTLDMRRMPLVLDLAAASLRGGQPVPAALAAVAPVAGGELGDRLRHVAGLLRLGAEPASAWATLSEQSLAPVVATACRSAESGVRLARGFERLAADLRDQARAAAIARAHRAGVWAMAPLGFCFLPAFACLGILPVIIGIAHGVLHGPAP